VFLNFSSDVWNDASVIAVAASLFEGEKTETEKKQSRATAADKIFFIFDFASLKCFSIEL